MIKSTPGCDVKNVGDRLKELILVRESCLDGHPEESRELLFELKTRSMDKIAVEQLRFPSRACKEMPCEERGPPSDFH